jgi:hypothetical protein
MITLNAKINLFGNERTLYCKSKSYEKNNISLPIEDVLNTKTVINGNPFVLGLSKVGKDKTFSKNSNCFIPKGLGSMSVFEIELYTQEAKGINKLTITFDTTNDVYENTIVIYDESKNLIGSYVNSSSVFTSPDLGGKKTILVNIFSTFNRKEPLIITGIFTGLSTTVSQKRATNLNSEIISRSDVELPSWGVKSNSSSLTFVDRKSTIKDYIENGLLEEQKTVVIYLNNTLSKKVEKVGTFTATDWEYDNDNKVVLVKYKDELEEWQNIYIDEITYIPEKSRQISANELYEKIYSMSTKLGYRMKSFDELDDQTKKQMNDTLIRFPFSSQKSLWEFASNLCEVCQLYFYTEKDGKINCVYGAD